MLGASLKQLALLDSPRREWEVVGLFSPRSFPLQTQKEHLVIITSRPLISMPVVGGREKRPNLYGYVFCYAFVLPVL